ncbi:MAG: peptidase S58 family protein [Chloroflexi bacterium AL-W]|nr:peptidase S58 family protein [Chloroflexi bacterium AL-N1]NOK68848.1 peptidase S58 family protein [Chloroflexi bacterium AL-N10]NOK76832.1 peptidase S58 family protein [Chloroflexi bacterium AL-N5]NOK82781.1 peptidase S58 family protein [Chloroflexi bacterium AL-W]NOK90689.1 peptidase S58 family protein [Chloroflexi bacterium AL-N15]
MSNTLTAVAGITVGHAQDLEALTGCTVVLFPEGTTGSVDVRGGAPGTRETDLLAPHAMIQHIDAICLSGGSAYGLAAATGVMRWLRERGIGYDVGVAVVPIVPAAVMFDLVFGAADRWPDEEMGYDACDAASSAKVSEGCIGVGTGATVGKLLGMQQAVKSGIGSAAVTLSDGVTIAALVVTNAFGDVYHEKTGSILAGARGPQGGFVNTSQQLHMQQTQMGFRSTNTTLAVVATDATLDKAGCQKLAQMAQDGLARAIRPIHTPFDGDVVFTAATGNKPALHLALLGSIAADVLVEAIERSVSTATALGGLPALSDLTS